MAKCVICLLDFSFEENSTTWLVDYGVCSSCSEKHGMTYGEIIKSLKEKGYL